MIPLRHLFSLLITATMVIGFSAFAQEQGKVRRTYYQVPDGNNLFNVERRQTPHDDDDNDTQVVFTGTGHAEDMALAPDGSFLVIGGTNGQVISYFFDGSPPVILLDRPGENIQGVDVTELALFTTLVDNNNPVLYRVPLDDPGNPVTVGDAATTGLSFPQDVDVFQVGDMIIPFVVTADGGNLIVTQHQSLPGPPAIPEAVISGLGTVVKVNVDVENGDAYYTGSDGKLYRAHIFDRDPQTGAITWLENPTPELLYTTDSGQNIKNIAFLEGLVTFTAGDQLVTLDVASGQIKESATVSPASIAVAANTCDAYQLALQNTIGAPGEFAVMDGKLTVPEGQTFGGLECTIRSDCTSNCGFVIEDVISDQPGFSIVIQVNEDGSANLLIVDLGGSHLEAGTYTLFEPVFNIDANTAHDHIENISLENVVISDKDGNTADCVLTTSAQARTGVRGDVTGGFSGSGDGQVYITDIVKVIKYIIGKIPMPQDAFLLFKIDANGDLKHNVGDVVIMIVQKVQQNGTAKVVAGPTGAVQASLSETMTLSDGRTAIPLYIKSDGGIAGAQADFLFDPAMLRIGEPQLTGHASPLSLQYHIDDGRLTLVAYSTEGAVIPAGHDVAVMIPVTLVSGGQGNPMFTLDEVVLADAQAQTIPVTLGETSVRISSVPTAFSLQPNAPNPFNPSTAIAYEVPQQAHITLIVYNLLGQEVARLVDRVQPVGRYSVVWNARNAYGVPVSSGVYLYRLTTDTGHSKSRRMVLLK